MRTRARLAGREIKHGQNIYYSKVEIIIEMFWICFHSGEYLGHNEFSSSVLGYDVPCR